MQNRLRLRAILAVASFGAATPVCAQTSPTLTYTVTVPITMSATAVQFPTRLALVCDAGVNLSYSGSAVSGSIYTTKQATLFGGEYTIAQAQSDSPSISLVVQHAGLTSSSKLMYLCYLGGTDIHDKPVTSTASVQGVLPLPT